MRLWLTLLCLFLLLFPTAVNSKIVFSSIRDGIRGIYVMENDGSNVVLLTNTLGPGSPRWSPNGKHIVFQRQVDPQDFQRYHLLMMNVERQNIRQLTEPGNNLDSHPSFSPDGKLILFHRREGIDNKNMKSSINVLNIESGKIKQISNHFVNHPDWSPDGKQILFSQVPGLAGTGNIWIMDANGENARELLPPLPVEGLFVRRRNPRWSSNGKLILYHESKEEFAVIDGEVHFIPHGYFYYIYAIDDGSIQQLNVPKNWKPVVIDWVDEGNSVVFTAAAVKLNQLPDDEPIKYNIYKYNITNEKITRLTEHPGQDIALDWISNKVYAVSPIGKQSVQWGELKKLSSD